MEMEPSFETPQDPEGLGPRSPLSFLREALAGALRPSARWFVLAWVMLQSLPALFWAFHLRSIAGSSALSSFWGEILRAADLWDFWTHGAEGKGAMGPLLPLTFIVLVLWTLWAGWKHQTEVVGLPGRFGSWVWGLLDTLLIGLLPLLLLGLLAKRALGWLGSTGIEGLGWVNLLGSLFIALAVPATLMVQWWLCRLNRDQEGRGWRLGSWPALGRHLGQSFLRLWANPVPWFLLISSGVLLRGGLQALVLMLAWRLGGGGLGKVWGFALLQLLVAAVNAMFIAWLLRLVAHFWRQDHHVRTEIRNLERTARSGGLS